MVLKLYQVNEIQNRIKTNPHVQKIVKGQELKENTTLSPFTIVENSIVGLTENDLIYKNYKRGVGKAQKGKASVEDRLNNTSM